MDGIKSKSIQSVNSESNKENKTILATVTVSPDKDFLQKTNFILSAAMFLILNNNQA